MPKSRIDILRKDEVLHQSFIRWFKVRFDYERFDGSRTEPIERYVLDRGESVGVLLHDVAQNEIVLVEQMRIAAADFGSPWLLELPAGRVDDGENPMHAAIRESIEETGAEPHDLELISTFFASPGTSTERLHLYYCPFHEGLHVNAQGGLADENEDLRVHRVGLAEASEMIRNGALVDAKTIIGIQWLSSRESRTMLGTQ